MAILHTELTIQVQEYQANLLNENIRNQDYSFKE